MVGEHKVEAGDPRFVLLWVSCAVRVTENHALEHAAAEANRLGLPVLAVFAIYSGFPGANERSFAFLQGAGVSVCIVRDTRAHTKMYTNISDTL